VNIIGNHFIFNFGEQAIYQLFFVDNKHLVVTVVKDYNYPTGTLNHFEIQMVEIRQNVLMITWTEPDTKNTITHVDDFEKKVAYTNITDIKSKVFYNLKGTIEALS